MIYQILKNDDEILILSLSYPITTLLFCAVVSSKTGNKNTTKQIVSVDAEQPALNNCGVHRLQKRNRNVCIRQSLEICKLNLKCFAYSLLKLPWQILGVGLRKRVVF